MQALEKNRGKNVRIVAGNTAYGVYKEWPTQDVLIHISKVSPWHRSHCMRTRKNTCLCGHVPRICFTHVQHRMHGHG